MSRLPVRGSTVATPCRTETALRTVLVELCPGGQLGKLDTKKFYKRLGIIIGRWSAEQGRLDTSPLVKTLTGMRKNLERIAEILSGHEEGIRESHDIEVVSHLTSVLAEKVGSLHEAKRLIDTFRRDAANFSLACLESAHQLKQLVGQDGRPRGDWHDDFTMLLQEIAEAVGAKPSLSTDRISGERVGWLVEAALALEAFLDPHMRSPSKEACGKRLARSLKTLNQRHRQNHPSA